LTQSTGAAPGSFTLITEAGVETRVVTRKAHAWAFELVPVEALLPNTTYVLTARWNAPRKVVETRLRFSTGDGPLLGVPALPSAMMEHYRIAEGPTTSCSPWATGTCLSFGDPDVLVEYSHIDEFGQVDMPYLSRGAAMIDLTGIDQGTNFRCVRLRTRAMNGTYSEPQTLCGADFPLTELSFTNDVRCVSTGLVSPGRPAPTSGGADGGAVGGGAPPPETHDADVPATIDGDDVPNGDGDAGQEAGPTVSRSGCSAGGAPTHGPWTFASVLMAVCAIRRRARRPVGA
jgi:hypothetical protein